MNSMLFLATTQLVMAFQEARDVLVIATPTLNEPRLVRSVAIAGRNGANLRVLLAPKADYLVDDGKLLVGSDPYGGSQREFKSLLSAGASIFVDPRFSPAGARSIRTNVRSGMSFAAMGTGLRSERVSLVCTGAMDARTIEEESNVCIQSDDKTIHKSLMALHDADFDDTQEQDIRNEKTELAKARLVVSPGDAAIVAEMIADADTFEVYTAAFDTVTPIAKRIMASGSKATLVVPPAVPLDAPALRAAVAKGVAIRHSLRGFSGTMIVTARSIFVGSQTITGADFSANRQVGLILNKTDVSNVTYLGARK